ncbi:MAG: hypothetical protein HYR70_00415 [Chloroflexi bacterium]|nr:hypothetical protein [Chloroflexota bacterium]
MNFILQVVICGVAWALTITRFRAIRWQDVWRDHGIALDVWLMMVFFSTTTIFMIKRFSNYFDVHTFNNLDRLIAYCSILTGITFGASASIKAVGTHVDRQTIRWLQYLPITTVAALLAMYVLFVSKIPNMDYLIPRSLPEVAFLFVPFLLGAALCAFVGKVYLGHLSLEKSPVMRARSICIVTGAGLASVYFLVKLATVLGYFWPVLASPALISLSSFLLFSAILVHFSSLLSNKLYIALVLTSRKATSWSSFKDLQRLTRRLQRLCPEVAFTTPAPSLRQFLADPEFYLYQSIVAIMDSKTMLDDFLLEGVSQELMLWEGDLLQEATRMKQALQSIDATEDFWDMVRSYRHASKALRAQPTRMLKEPLS